MEGISMNINFNKLLQNLMPFLYVIFIAYILSVLVFFFLPKNGVEFVLDKSSNLEYKKYSFYSNNQKTEDKTLKENKTIQTLDKYQLKAIYYVNSNKGWITVQEKVGNKSHILSYGESIDGYVLNELFFDYVIFIKNEKEYKLEITKSSITNFDMNKPIKELFISNKIKFDELNFTATIYISSDSFTIKGLNTDDILKKSIDSFLEDFLKIIIQEEDIKFINIYSHTSDEYRKYSDKNLVNKANIDLSQRRANKIKDYFITKAKELNLNTEIINSKLNAIGKGSNNLIYDLNNSVDVKSSRRIEIEIIKKDI